MSQSEPADELWRSISAIYRMALKALNSRLAEERLTFQQYSILRSLGKNGPMQMNRLSEYMLVVPANVTGLVDRLEKKGYVRRARDENDRRLYRVELTKRGASLFSSVSLRFHEYVRNIFASLSEEEKASISLLLERVRNGTERTGAG